ncbi:MAG: ornithine cyclodeaminase family protein [Rhodospirillaceae bacterium]
MHAPPDLRYLSKGDMAALDVGAAAVVDAIEALCRGREAGTAMNAPKRALKPGANDPRFFMSTLALGGDPPFMAVKALGLNETNVGRELESIGALVTLFDGDTGHPLAVMDGDWITAVRTAGLSALAARHMARPEASTLALVGCGVQARSHLELFAGLYPLREVRALGRGRANRDAVLATAAGEGLDAVAVDTPEAALDGADIVVSTVPAHAGFQPFLDANRLAPGTFVTMVDLARSWLPGGLDAFARIVIDDAPQEATMSQPMIEMARVAGDLQDLVAGRLAGRTDAAERTAFAFRGLALGDLALAILAFEAARAAGIGTTLPR